MNKKDQRKQIEEVLHESMIVEVWQDKPYTAVKVGADYEENRWWAYGFSKVQYPDKWDKDYGIELAVDKAIARIAKEIMVDKAIAKDTISEAL